MTHGLRLAGIRVRSETSIKAEVSLVTKQSENSWSARIYPADRVDPGDRPRFGDTSENPLCFLAYLDADVREKSGETVLLSFHFSGAALDDALGRLGQIEP